MKGSHIYQTRRDWILLEAYMGLIAVFVAMVLVQDGPVGKALAQSSSQGAAFWLFFVMGTTSIVLPVEEAICRHRPCMQRTLQRFAVARFCLHFIGAVLWMLIFVWAYFSLSTHSIVFCIAAISMAFHLCGAWEHAKAMCLDKRRAGTTSLARFLVQRLHRG